MTRSWRLSICCLLVLSIVSRDASAAEPEEPSPTSPVARYTSKHFQLVTDLPPAEARRTLTRMEAVMGFSARYWGREVRGQVDCYLADDLDCWPDTALPHPLASVWIGAIGGATIYTLREGDRRPRSQATIYASCRPGIVEHEVAHAYCAQAFDRLGPDWYKEGMAEVARYHAAGRPRGLACSPERIALLRNGTCQSVRQIVSSEQFTNDLDDSLGAMVRNRDNQERNVPLSDWTRGDTSRLKKAETSYAWSWALCHMLVHNRNFSRRFRTLGESYLGNRDDSFSRAFDSVQDELEFEFKFFTQRVDAGYRVDLCRWDWNKRFCTLDKISSKSATIEAARGFQASGLIVEEGESYHYTADGTWTTAPETAPTDAMGDADGKGQLVAVILSDFQLTEPIPLGTQGAFVAPSSGKLYLRCNSAWHQIADNDGQLRVQFTQP